jgi:hypothetical protein
MQEEYLENGEFVRVGAHDSLFEAGRTIPQVVGVELADKRI